MWMSSFVWLGVKFSFLLWFTLTWNLRLVEIDQSINQSISQSVSQSVSQSIKSLFKHENLIIKMVLLGVV